MTTVLKNVSKLFAKTLALKGIDLEIDEGEFVAILGPSGCGKTTLLRLLAGFERPNEGEIVMESIKVSDKLMNIPPEKRDIGMVFQSFALWPHLTVKEHIRFPLQHHRSSKRILKLHQEQRINEMLKIVGLENFGTRLPNELSGGQKQRVAIARALASQPSLLLMDEPLSSLDAELRMELRHEIKTIHRLMKPSILYVTHDQSEALAMADKIVVMKEGSIEQIGTPEEIFFHPKTPFVATFVSKANLIKGTWEESVFFPFHNKTVPWNGSEIPLSFRRAGVFPARPEQLTITNKFGLKGIIENVMFQGKESHYRIKINNTTITVHVDQERRLKVGDVIGLELLNQKQDQVEKTVESIV
ncbi:ABC transporter ATP-binding protein [Halalkalibacter urbisdiaboli]|uniref:ABC transporter ATP-binding protein n=1 Tax=Halalkalibacter urbisdiaboli TaxID=1960589 RepID=UPI000B44A580|nr:ABC transporter ATP-binding protein [Halalkalibacter urbisdiaboli]